MKKHYAMQRLLACLFVSFTFTVFTNAQSFNATGLNGENLNNPTSLDFGPNGKLYVSQQDGTIFEYTVLRDKAEAGSGTYTAINANTIALVKTGTPNHNDDGTINTANERQVTGLLATGTQTAPILYVSSSDSRIGGGGSGNDKNLDTNSGVLSRLTWTGSAWDKVDLVRGLPRCEENHSTNGMEIFERNGTTYLLLQQGGNANKGAPSNNFAGTSETYLSGAMLLVNLTQLEQMEASNGGPYIDTRQGTTKYIYDLPTLNDPERLDIDNTHSSFPYTAGHPLYNSTIDLGDPFGGNNGLNQAFPEVGGPVQIFSTGWRNGYDVVITADGRIYSVDNGPNTTWGGLPVIYDSNDQFKGDQSNTTYNPAAGDYVTNEINEVGSSGHGDALHYVGNITDTNGSYYAGHPAPIRAFSSRAGVKVYTFDGSNWVLSANHNFGTLLTGVSGYFNTTFDISDFPDDPIQGEYLATATSDPRMRIFDIVNSSTNGMCEYTASNFGGAMQGDLLTASFNGKINRYQLNASGNGILSKNNSFLTGFGSTPLDVIAQSDTDPFPGTIWAATYGADNITVFEPTDFSECIDPSDPEYVGSEDYDSDGYSNDDEVANGTDICSGGSQPNDYDGDFISDLNDPDDDNDGIPDSQDAFAIDADNGTTTNLPIDYPFWNNDPGTGFFGLGFTGLMLDTSGNTEYLNQYDENNLSFGGAGGKATIDAVTSGTAYEGANSQKNAFQFGVNLTTNSKPFTIHSKIETPFANVSSATGLSYGIYIGNGDQDHYLKVVVADGLTENDNLYGFEVVKEDGASNVTSQKYDVTGLKGATSVDIYININPTANTAQPYYSVDGGENVILLGNPIVLPVELLNPNDAKGLAVGLISTSGSGEAFTATWDFLKVTEDAEANLVLSENPVDYGVLETGSDQVQLIPTLTNEGGPSTGAIEITEVNITGIDATLFSHNLTLPLVIGPGADKTLPLNFFPNDISGIKNANLQIVHNGANSPFIVPLTAILEEFIAPNYTIVARINAGGNSVTATDGNIDWEANLGNGAASGSSYSVNTGTIPGGTNTFLYENRHTSVPDYIDETTFNALYGKERYDATSGPEMEFKLPVPNGNYLVNIYTGNGYGPTNNIGARVFDISLENEIKGDDIDVVALFGGNGNVFNAGMLSYPVTVADGELNILFEHIGIENPVLQAIEVMASTTANDPISITPIADQLNASGDQSALTISAIGGDSEENFTYAISGQPEGIDVETTNGQIFGTIATNAITGGPNNDGVYNVTIVVSKPGSVTKSISFVWTIENLLWKDKEEDENYTARHECSLVQAGDKFYLMGGRENAKTIDVYDYTTNTWTQIPNSPPEEFNHFQATEYKGLIWVIGAFKSNSYPNEEPTEYVWAFNPANEEWIQGPEIPENRRRGSTGLVVYNDKFYISGGNTIGHNGGYVSWFDEYDPSTGIWTPLSDAPRARDHFHAGVVDNKMYLMGGRLSGGAGGVFSPTISEVDVYDFNSGTWSTLPTNQNIPTPRAAPIVATFNGKLIVAGGEVENQEVYGQVTSNALKITEQYDPITQTWTRLPDMNNARHGTQAIVSGNGLFVLAGSPKLAGGNQKNMEFLGEDLPVGSASIASALSIPEVVNLEVGDSKTFDIEITGGNIGMFIRSIELTGADAANYTITSGNIENVFLDAESIRQLTVSLNDSGEDTNAILTIHYGASSSVDIILRNGESVSNIIDPGTQYNAEGDEVSLQILTEETENNVTFSATGLPPTLIIDATTGIINGTVVSSNNSGDGAFLEENGLIVIEAESGNLESGWVETTLNGATGILATTNNFNSQNGGTIPYQITVSTPGVYKFDWRSFYSGESATDENDNWLRFPNNEDVWFFGYKGNPVDEASLISNVQGDQLNVVFPKGSSRITVGPDGTTPEGSSSNGYFKIYRSGGLSETYDWQARTSDNDSHDVYVWFVNPGTYTMEVSERSAGHAIDKMALYKVDGPTYSDNQLTSANESSRAGDNANVGDNSPYNVTVTATDNNDPTNKSDVEFTWVINDTGNPVAIASATPLEGQAPLEVNFIGSESTDDIGIVDYSWEFGDALFSTSDLADPTFTFNDAGTYNVLLRVTDGNGNQNTEALVITVTEPTSHVITAIAGENGVISPNAEVEVINGANQQFNIIANAGYKIADVLVDGVSQGAVESFTFEAVSSEHTIEASFEEIFKVIMSSSSLGGTISPSGAVSVAQGEDHWFTAAPNEGYKFAYFIVDNSFTVGEPTYAFENVNDNHTIEAVFTEIGVNQFTISATSGEGGMITPDGENTVVEGESIRFSVTASDGYEIDKLIVDGKSLLGLSEYTFEDISENHTFDAVFKYTGAIKTYTITATGTEGGELSPYGAIEVAKGQEQDFIIVPNEGYRLVDILIDEVSTALVEEYKFANLVENHSIHVVFEKIDNNPPKAFAAVDIKEGIGPLLVNFDGDKSTDDTGIASYSWDFGDESLLSTGFEVSHTYIEAGVYTATLTVIDDNGEVATDSITITVNDSLTDSEVLKEFRLFPNPASVNVSLSFGKVVDLDTISIYDMSGKLVLHVNAKDVNKGRNYELSVINLSSGLYLVRTIDMNGDEINKRLLIQR
ncbi:PKD domain-containing protein [Zobellia nedashkovskayae]|uniref:PKD domain-containing protein n=2 Tax=Zobellia TaxID=112040 RepID=UPI00188ABFEC|nr:PKD domain-containing protein [Zobellia nedashkovskayae]